MKKLFYTATIVALSILAASCQRENLEPLDAQVVTYTVQLPDAIGTKALGDGMTLHYEVYRTDAEKATDFTTGATLLYHKEEAFANGVVNLDLELVNNQNFTVLFWAQTNGNDAFDCDDLTNVTISTDLKANQENYAVFSGHDFIKSGEQLTGREIKLVRPVAQLNIATTAASLESFNSLVTIDKSSVTLTGKLATSYNVATLAAGTAADVEFTYSAHEEPSGEFKTDYPYVAMNYVAFVDADGENVKVDYTIKTSVGDITNTIGNVPLKPNYRTNILGNLITETSDYEVSLEADWGGADEEVEVITDGLVKINGVYNVSNANGLAYASQNLFAEGGSYVLTEDIDMSEYTALETRAGDKFWKSAEISHKTFSFDGKGHSISNLPGMFVSYTISGDLTIKNLTLNNPNIAYDVEDTSENKGVGAFFGLSDVFNKILLENCHVKGGEIEGGHWTGGLIGYASGWSEAGTLTIKNCSVKEATVTGKGSCGGIIGHANGGNGLVEMDTISVFSNTIESTGTATDKAGSVMGTVGSSTVKVTNCSVIDNEVTSNSVNNTKLWGRQGGTGVLYVDGVQVEDFGTFTPSTTVTVTNDAELAKAVEVIDVEVIKLAAGTYSENIVLTVAEAGAFQRDIKFEAVEGASPVIAGTVTLGYRIQGTGAAMWNGDITFEGITFDHANAATHSLDVQDVKSLTLKNCTIIGDGEYGLGSSRGNATGPSLIDNCTFENAAMQILGNLGTGLVINECTFNESRINVQAGNGVTVQNCNFTNTLTNANVGDSFYLIRSNSTPITVKECNIAIDSDLAEVVTTPQAKWYILANRGTTNWTVENVAVTMTDAALMQTELKVTACTSTGVINSTNMTVNGKTYASTTSSLKSALTGNADVTLGDGDYSLPGVTSGDVTISGSEDVIITIDKPAYHSSDLTLNGVTVKGLGYSTGVQHVNNVTYNDVKVVGEMCLYGEKVVFNGCTFELNNQYIWTYGANEVEFNDCTFNTNGKAILVYNEGDGASKVTVKGCTFNATAGAKAGAIANQNCAAVEIDNFQSSGNGVAHVVITEGNTYGDYFSGEWRIKNYVAGNPVTVNGTEYTQIALDGKLMTIDANKNVTVL